MQCLQQLHTIIAHVVADRTHNQRGRAAHEEAVSDVNRQQHDVCRLNVGGVMHHSAPSALGRETDSMFGGLLRQRARNNDSEKHTLIDRDGVSFTSIIHYLRYGAWFSTSRKTKRDADFYCLPLPTLCVQFNLWHHQYTVPQISFNAEHQQVICASADQPSFGICTGIDASGMEEFHIRVSQLSVDPFGLVTIGFASHYERSDGDEFCGDICSCFVVGFDYKNTDIKVVDYGNSVQDQAWQRISFIDCENNDVGVRISRQCQQCEVIVNGNTAYSQPFHLPSFDAPLYPRFKANHCTLTVL